MSQAEGRIMFSFAGFDAAVEVKEVPVSEIVATVTLLAEELAKVGATGRTFPAPKPVPVVVAAGAAPSNGKPAVAVAPAPGGAWQEIDGVRVSYDEKRKLWVRESQLAAWCPVHGCWMDRRQNDTGAWYSHRENGGWCKGKEK